MTSPALPTWDQFADEVLPHVGLPALRVQLQRVCSELPPDRIEYWSTQFNDMDDDLELRFAHEQDSWTEEEIDGVWYDRMKSIALQCLTEVHGGES